MTDKIGALERLARLRDEGTLTQDEFLAQKATLLGGATRNAGTAGTSGSVRERWRQAREESRGTRRVLRWFWLVQLFAIVLIGAYFLTRGATLERARQTQATTAQPADNNVAIAPTPSAPAPGTAPAPAQTEAQAFDQDANSGWDVVLTEDTLAAAAKPDDSWSQSTQDVCPHVPVMISNRSGHSLTLDIRASDGSSGGNLGTIDPGRVLQFRSGKIGTYIIGQMTNNVSHALYLLNVVNCPPND